MNTLTSVKFRIAGLLLVLGGLFLMSGCDLAGNTAAILTVNISTPASDAKVFSNFTVSGTAVGPYRITNVVVELQNSSGYSSIQTVDITSSSNFSTSFTVTNLGIYTVYAHTLDTSGASGSSATNRFLVTENAPLILTIASPTNNQKIASNFTVTGNIGGTTTTTQINLFALKKTGATTYSSTTNTTNVTISGIDFSGSLLLSQYGSYMIWTSAQINSNQTTNSEKVLVEVVGDTVSLSITNPITNSGIIATNISNVLISGTADVNFASLDGIYMTVSNATGTSYRKVSGLQSWNYSLDSVLTNGSNFIIVDALKTSGTVADSKSIWVIYDTDGPTNLLNFTNDQIYSNSSITFSGIAKDSESGAGRVYFSLDNASFSKVASSSNWSTNLTLSEGSYNIRVYSVNKAGVYSLTNSVDVNVYQQSVYVTTSGSDSNPGTENQPIRSIQAAIERAVQIGMTEVRVSSGNYEPGSGLNANGSGIIISNNNISLKGGWNSTFTSQTSHTVLNGNKLLTTIIRVNAVTNVSIDGFDIIGGKNTSGQGAGIYASGVTEFLVENSVLSNHSANLGGAIYIAGGTNVSLSGVGSPLVIAHSSASDGGGIYLTGGTNYSLNNLTLYDCSAANSSGGIYINDAQAVSVLSSVLTNSYGGSVNSVIYITGAGTSVNLKINGNTLGGNGSTAFGVYEGTDINGLELKNNVFLVTSLKLGHFYYDPSYLNIDALANLTVANIDGVAGGVTGNSDL